tara:strand:- start:241 stop:465 length:225 start_codon:yes stop_codon:yes gene_type:complete
MTGKELFAPDVQELSNEQMVRLRCVEINFTSNSVWMSLYAHDKDARAILEKTEWCADFVLNGKPNKDDPLGILK